MKDTIAARVLEERGLARYLRPLSTEDRERLEHLHAKRYAAARGHAFRAAELAHDMGARGR